MRSLRASRLSSPSPLSLSPQKSCSRPLFALVALCWIPSSMSRSFLYRDTVLEMRPHHCWEEEGLSSTGWKTSGSILKARNTEDQMMNGHRDNIPYQIISSKSFRSSSYLLRWEILGSWDLLFLKSTLCWKFFSLRKTFGEISITQLGIWWN